MTGHARMVALLAQVAESRPYGFDYDGEVMALRGALDNLSDKSSLPERIAILAALAASEFEAGMDGGLARMQLAFDLSTQLPENRQREFLLPIAYHLAVAHFRHTRKLSCVHDRRDDTCTIPIREGAAIERLESRQSAREAIRYFTFVLAATPANAPRNITSKWLLNLTYMLLGDYPAQVPPQYLITADAFESAKFPWFANVARQAGLDAPGYAGGLIADDFDNDGLLDVMVSSVHANYQVRLFKNKGDGTFEDVTDESGIKGITGGLNMVQTDYNNDGFLDVYLTRGAWLAQDGQIPDSLLRNNGDLTFTDVTFDAGLGEHHYPTQTAVWTDFDNDGDLDLYVGNETTAALRSPCELFRNEGDGTFVEIARQAGVENYRFTKAVTAGDYNNDGFDDLYVSNMDDVNRLYRNNRDGTFTDVAAELGVTGPHSSFTTWFWDLENDGDLDLIVNNYAIKGLSLPLQEIAGGYIGLPGNMELSKLYLNTGQGGFVDVTQRYGLTSPTLSMGSNFGDLDNDGFLDFYLGTGYMTYEAVMPNLMYRNVGGGRFEDVTFSGGFGTLAKGHGIAFADIDNDGDQDVLTRLGGAFLHDISYDSLHENPGAGNHWITIKLIGKQTNRAAIGARLRIDVLDGQRIRSIYRTVTTGGSFGGNPLRREIGLGQATRVAKLEVHWPVSGLTQTFRDLPSGEFIQITEGQDQIVTLEPARFRLGGSGAAGQ